MSLNDENKRFLIVRFSSFGDVLLTTALIRNLKKNYPNSHLTFIVKQPFNQMLDRNPYIDQIHIFKSIEQTRTKFSESHFNYFIDLQHNPLSIRLKKQIKHDHYFFYDKLSISRYAYVQFKKGNYNLPIRSVPQRYIDAVKFNLDIDSTKPDFFIDPKLSIKKYELSDESICIAPGAAHFTKQWPVESFIELINPYESKKYPFRLESNHNRTQWVPGCPDSSILAMNKDGYVFTVNGNLSTGYTPLKYVNVRLSECRA